jgi:formamidase
LHASQKFSLDSCALYRCEIIRGGMKEYLTPVGPTPLHVNPIFEIGPVEPRFSEWLVFEGISVDESGKQHFLDASVAYKRAVLNAIEYLSRFGYSKEQAYLLLSCCPCEGRISGIVDSPNAVTTLAIPTAIFDQVYRQQPSPTQFSLVCLLLYALNLLLLLLTVH